MDQEEKNATSDQGKDEEIQAYKAKCSKYKALAQEWKARHSIMEQRVTRLCRAMQILTCQRNARLNWLYGLGDLHIRIAEDFRLEIGDAIDAAYEEWQK